MMTIDEEAHATDVERQAEVKNLNFQYLFSRI